MEDDHQVKRWKTTVIIDELTLLDGKDSNSSKMPDEALQRGVLMTGQVTIWNKPARRSLRYSMRRGRRRLHIVIALRR